MNEWERDTGRAWLEIDAGALAHNVRALQGALPEGCRLMAVLKADAYGHGAARMGPFLETLGVTAFAVATVDEGICLREHGVKGTILILGYTDPRQAAELSRFDLTQTVIDLPYAAALNEQGTVVRVHIKLDTGMHRLGLPYDRPEELRAVFGMERLRVEGLFTHLCCCDSLLPEDAAFTREQLRWFDAAVEALRQSGLSVPALHVQSSAGLLNYPDVRCDYARAGLALYGAVEGDTRLRLGLRPVLSLKARVVLVRTVKRGEWVGYGRAFRAARDSRIGILSVGYADGYPRALSEGRGSVLICGHVVPVIGRVCMDQLAVDLTDAAEVEAGDIAALIGAESPVTAPEVAAAAGTISNELLSCMGSRLPVVWSRGGEI